MGSHYQTKDSQGNIYQVTDREKSLLLSIYEEIDDIAMDEEWNDFWSDAHKLEPMNEYSNNRKFLWTREENKWLYTDMEIEIEPSSEVVEKFLALAIEIVKDDHKKVSNFLDSLTPQKTRILLEVFDCFEFI
ncbi:MAG: hypothetical protein NT070_17300 [Cyanobacteria bacterium]|nr:hypothetical protein [Cyanobacteriota bacterium]